MSKLAELQWRVQLGDSGHSEVLHHEALRLRTPVNNIEYFIIFPQTSRGSFSAVSTPIFASKYALESSRRDLHNALLCTALKSHFFKHLLEFCQNLRKISEILLLKKKCWISQILQKNGKHLTKKWDYRAVQRSALCRSRREPSNAYLVAKFGLDTAENEPRQVCPTEPLSSLPSW